jgi:hypothetical protein
MQEATTGKRTMVPSLLEQACEEAFALLCSPIPAAWIALILLFTVPYWSFEQPRQEEPPAAAPQ